MIPEQITNLIMKAQKGDTEAIIELKSIRDLIDRSLQPVCPHNGGYSHTEQDLKDIVAQQLKKQ